VHHIPGRLRIRLPKSRRSPRLYRELQDFVQGLGGVRHVEINPTTGSILVHYEPESHEQVRSMVHSAATSDEFQMPPGLGDADQLAETIEKEAEFLAAHSELALHVVNSVKSLDRTVRQATDNTVDLKVLVPAAFAVWAFFSVGVEVSTPLWVSLGIFSFNSFVALHRPTTVQVATHETEVGSGS
jgi:cation transport ATPase